MNRVSLNDVYKFILKNRRGGAFPGFSKIEIRHALAIALETQSIIVDTDETGKEIFGVALGTPAPEYKLMHVNQILTIRKHGGMARLMQHFVKLFPGWEMQAERHGNLVRYKDFNKLVKKVSIYG